MSPAILLFYNCAVLMGLGVVGEYVVEFSWRPIVVQSILFVRRWGFDEESGH